MTSVAVGKQRRSNKFKEEKRREHIVKTEEKMTAEGTPTASKREAKQTRRTSVYTIGIAHCVAAKRCFEAPAKQRALSFCRLPLLLPKICLRIFSGTLGSIVSLPIFDRYSTLYLLRSAP